MAIASANEHSGDGSSPARRRRHGLAIVATLVVLMVLLAGCGGISEQRVGADDLRFLVHDRPLTGSSAGMDAEVTGALTTADACILLEQDGNRVPVVWPRGTSVAATDPLEIELPSGEQLRAGDQLRGGGGYLEAASLEIEVSEACVNEYGEVAVFNLDDDPEVVLSWVSPTSAPGLQCSEDVVVSAVYDYGDAPPPDGVEPLEAVEAFFGAPQDAQRVVKGLEVHVLRDARTVAIIGLRSVPGGYVVGSHDACQESSGVSEARRR